MSLAAFLPLRSPYPHQRSPPDTFSPRVHFSPRPVLAPMSRVPRIETASSSRRANNLPRDPSDWVDKDLLSYVRYNYSPIEAVPLSEVIERDRLTPTALWYLQSEPEQLLMIAEEESLRDTLLGLALSLKPAVSPTSPRIRHVRRLSEDLEHPPPPPPPPPPSPPTPEEPELEEDDDVAESVVSDWALDEDLDGDHGPTPTMDDLGDLAGSAAQPEPPVEGLGLHTGEPHLDDVTTPQPQPSTMETDDLINLEDDPQPTVPQEEAPEPHATRVDTGAADDPQVEEPTSSQSASTDARVPDAAGEKPPPGTHHHADPPAPLDDDLGNPWAEDTLGAESSTPSPPPPPPADPPRKVTPTSDYHDANSIHSDEGERQETLPAEQEPEPSPVHPEERDDPATSGDGIEDQPTTEAPLFTETPEKGETAENTSSGEDASTHEEAQLEENTAPASSEDPIEASSSAADPVQPTDPVQTAEPVHGPPLVTDPTELSPLTTDPVTAPPSEITETLEERVSPAGGPERDETAQVGADDSKDTQPEVPPVQSTTSGVASSEQSEETVEPEGRENGHLSGEDDANKTDGETVDKVDQEAVDEAGKDEEATVPPITTTEPAETTVPPVATAHTVNDSPVLDESSDKDASDVQANEQASSSETPAAQPEAEANSLSPAQDEDTSEKSSIPSGPSAAESTASPLLVTDTTPATTTISAPPSPTVRLASGIEAQLVNLDPDSTEQTPSASPSDTPPGASSSPSESRQASPPAQAEAEKPVPPATRVRMSASSSSLSSTNPIEGKPPAPPPINTAFGSFSEPPRRARPPTDPLTDNNPSAFRSTLSPATAKSVGWGSAQSPTAKGTGSWGRGLFSSVSSSVSSLFNPASEPSSREPSQERETPYPRMLVPPAPVSARPSLAARSSPRGQSKPWAAVASSSTSSQQASKLKSPDVSAAEPSFNVGPAQVLPPTDTKSTIEPPAPTLPPAPVAPPPEKSAIQETNPRAEEVTDVMSDSVLVDPETPSVGNGEPARDAESSRAPPVRAVASSEGDSRDSGNLGGKEETEDVEDEDMVKVTADDAAGADKAGAESQPQGDVAVDDDDNDDDDDNLPLNRRLERVRQITGDSVSTAVTSDTEAQDDDQQSSRRMGPKLRTSGLANAPDGVDSPVVDSPITPLSKSAKKRKNKKKNKAQGGP